MDDQIKLAFEFASNLTEQLITLSTGILALTFTFSKEILKEIPQRTGKLLISGWIIYLISIIFGIWHLMALTGSLAPLLPSVVIKEENINIGTNARVPAALQIITFVLGTSLLIWFGATLLKRKASIDK